MALSFGRQASKDTIQETTKNLRSSFTEGSSKIFGSVKKGFFDGISSTFDQVVNIVGSNEEDNNADQQQQTSTNPETASATEKEGSTPNPATTSSKPKPPKPPAPFGRQKSSGSNGSLKKTFDSQGSSEDPTDKNKSTGKPPLKRRNTNPFTEDYEPASAEADLPSTVVAEVYQMVSALYSDKGNEDQHKSNQPKELTKKESKKISHDDADSEGTEGCDDVADVANDFDSEGQIAEESAGVDNATRECSDFMKTFVNKVFESSAEITPNYKSKFCELSQNGFGRLWFAENITSKKEGQSTKIADETFYALVQFFTIVLFECNESEDYGTAKSLMNSCFVFYCESDPAKGSPQKQYLYSFLKDLPIWHSPKFWNAAYFYALQHERASQNGNAENDKTNEISFKQLGLIAHYMRLLGLSEGQCLEYIKRQAMTANLTQDQVKQLKHKMEKWVEGTDPNEDDTSGALWFISQKAKAVNAAARLLKDGFSFRSALKSDH